MSRFERKIRHWVKIWEGRDYAEGIPDAADANLEAYGKVPSYRRICRAIIKNDTALMTLGFSRPQSQWYDAIKRVEIEGRE